MQPGGGCQAGRAKISGGARVVIAVSAIACPAQVLAEATLIMIPGADASYWATHGSSHIRMEAGRQSRRPKRALADAGISSDIANPLYTHAHYRVSLLQRGRMHRGLAHIRQSSRLSLQGLGRYLLPPTLPVDSSRVSIKIE